MQKRQIIEDGNGERNACGWCGEEAAMVPEVEAIDEYGKECQEDGTTQEELEVCSRRLDGETAEA